MKNKLIEGEPGSVTEMADKCIIHKRGYEVELDVNGREVYELFTTVNDNGLAIGGTELSMTNGWTTFESLESCDICHSDINEWSFSGGGLDAPDDIPAGSYFNRTCMSDFVAASIVNREKYCSDTTFYDAFKRHFVPLVSINITPEIAAFCEGLIRGFYDQGIDSSKIVSPYDDLNFLLIASRD